MTRLLTSGNGKEEALRKSRTRIALVAALLMLAGGMGSRGAHGQGVLAPSITTASTGRAAGTDDLVAPVRPGKVAFTMETGRLAKVPVSTAQIFTLRRSQVGPGSVLFRAVCTAADTAGGRCDTGMLVLRGTLSSALSAHFNDDSPDPGRGAGAAGSLVAAPPLGGAANYTVVVFSMMRATSRTAVDYSIDDGATWRALTPNGPVEAGGTVVRVGSLARGDFLEVQTRTDGAGVDDTRMIVFDRAGSRPPRLNDNRGTRDRDPSVSFLSGDWQGGDNHVLLTKVARTTTSNRGVETRVDLVHGPSKEESVSRTGCLGPCGAALSPGQYLISIFASIELPVGAYSAARSSTWHPSSQMPILDPASRPEVPEQYRYNRRCPVDTEDGIDATTWYRGTPNDFALTMTLQKWSEASKSWADWKTRRIPRGAFGAQGPDWNKFSIQETVEQTTRYRVVTSDAVSGVRVFEDWRHERNPMATELAVASYNALYKDTPFSANKYRNLANLLGTRGSIDTGSGQVEERPDQAPFQWEADVLALQEVQKGFLYYRDWYTLVVRDELLARGALGWTFAQGQGEHWRTELGDGPGMSPIFVNSHLYPSGGDSSVFFDRAAKIAAGCEDDSGEPFWNRCHLNERGYGNGDIYNYAVAARIAAWRDDDDANRPIAMFNVHMEASSGPNDFAPRIGELESLMERIDGLLRADHRAFNRAPAGAPDRWSPRHYQNRFIILGDWNVRAHECGEHYWMVRKLREHYGYAVDVAMALPDALGSLKQGMHTGDRGYGADGVPRDFQHWSHDDPRPERAWTAWHETRDRVDSDYPWWAVDWRGTTSTADKPGERLSMIVLVGRGWAHDDPVLGYEIMSDSNHPSPMSPLGLGVEMWRPYFFNLGGLSYICDDPGAVIPGTAGYAPNHSLGCEDSPHGGTRAGAPALHSDHKPMGAWLRVWTR